jgi:hypothetical protein
MQAIKKKNLHLSCIRELQSLIYELALRGNHQHYPVLNGRVHETANLQMYI